MSTSTNEQTGKRTKTAKAPVKAAKQVKVVEVALTKRSAKQAKSSEAPAAKKKAKAVKTAQTTQPAAELRGVPSQEDSEVMIKSFQRSMAKKQNTQPKKSKVSYTNFLAKTPASGKKYSLDLRIHTPATVGYFASGGVSPASALIRLAKSKGLDVVGLTDYFNASYVDIVRSSPDRGGMSILPGFDLCCAVAGCRDVHFTCLFPETSTSADLFAVLNELGVPKEQYGRSDYVLPLALDEIIKLVEGRGGILIPTQLDKTPYRQLAIKTLIEDYGMHVFDLVHPENLDFFRDRWPAGQFTFLSFSNSSALAQIGTRISKVKISSPDFAGIKELVKRRAPLRLCK